MEYHVQWCLGGCGRALSDPVSSDDAEELLGSGMAVPAVISGLTSFRLLYKSLLYCSTECRTKDGPCVCLSDELEEMVVPCFIVGRRKCPPSRASFRPVSSSGRLLGEDEDDLRAAKDQGEGVPHERVTCKAMPQEREAVEVEAQKLLSRYVVSFFYSCNMAYWLVCCR
jgi:hypothetical protein